MALSELQKLVNKKSKLEDRLITVQEREHEKIRNLGWGSGMRGYKRQATLNLSGSDKIEAQIQVP